MLAVHWPTSHWPTSLPQHAPAAGAFLQGALHCLVRQADRDTRLQGTSGLIFNSGWASRACLICCGPQHSLTQQDGRLILAGDQCGTGSRLFPASGFRGGLD